MHRGVRDFIVWLDANKGKHPEVALNPPAPNSELTLLERNLGGPLPGDLRFVLTRFNGGTIPSGTMLPLGNTPGTIGAAVKEYATKVGADFLDPELLLPFHRTNDGSLLCFDRSAGPVSDTWPIVDYLEDAGERLVHRTFDGWCRSCVSEWSSADFSADFTLDTYLRKGMRHLTIEPDVASAHATVAHGLKRAGRPTDALARYLRAAKCVPSLAWCDWEALKIAAIIGDEDAGFEAAARLSSRAPEERWSDRETSPGRVAEAIAPFLVTGRYSARWSRVLNRLLEQAEGEERAVIEVYLKAIGEDPITLPLPRPTRDESLIPQQPDIDAWFDAAKSAYASGHLRDEDLLFDPNMRRLSRVRDLRQLLSIRRDF